MKVLHNEKCTCKNMGFASAMWSCTVGTCAEYGYADYYQSYIFWSSSVSSSYIPFTIAQKKGHDFQTEYPSSLMIPNLQKSYLDRFPATQQAPLKPHDETTGNEHNHLDFLAVVAIPAHLPMERFASEDNFGPNYFESCHPSKMNNQKSKQIIGLGSSRGPGLRIKPQKHRWKLVGTRYWRKGPVLLDNVRHVSCPNHPNVHSDAFKSLTDADWKGPKPNILKIKKVQDYFKNLQIKRGHLANTFTLFARLSALRWIT